MSNQQKAEEVSDDVGIQIFLGCCHVLQIQIWVKFKTFI
jgi:hypothetical protein